MAEDHRQAKGGEHRVAERRDLRDPVLLDPEDVEFEGPELRVAGPAEVAPGCRLPGPPPEMIAFLPSSSVLMVVPPGNQSVRR